MSLYSRIFTVAPFTGSTRFDERLPTARKGGGCNLRSWGRSRLEPQLGRIECWPSPTRISRALAERLSAIEAQRNYPVK